jgi:type I restriction enzyme R subunit
MSYEYSEDGLVENATEEVLRELGWEVETAWRRETLGEHGLLGREEKSEILLRRYLRQALEKLNPDLPSTAYEQAIEQLEQWDASKTLERINKDKYEMMRNGVEVQYTDDKGGLRKRRLRVFDFKDYNNNHFLAVRQFEVVGELYNRRPDIIGFVNGIPLVFFELKAHHTDISRAYYDNLKDYKDTIPQVFAANAFIILSNGTDAKVGTITSPYKYFLEWKRIEENEEGVISLDTMLRGTCAPYRLMDIFENFLLFDDSSGGVVKLMAKNHQYLGVNKVIGNVRHIEDLQGKLGVFWHTQGSGKSYSMVFLCEKIHRKLGGSYTFLIVADRSELERQLYDTFSGVGIVQDEQLIAGKKKGMTGREHLRELLADNHRYVFTLIHKFSFDPKKESEYPLITERKNIIVISDEAHRTQAGTFARNMRFKGIPNASYLGFTGTPIIKEEQELTADIFGDYVSVYDFKRAIEDEATLPLRYVNRGEKLDIQNPELDERMAEVFENENLDDDQKKKLEYLFKREYPVLTAEPRLNAIAKDLVWHFNERGYQGKAMLVTLDKPTAVRMYDLINKHWAEYLDNLDQSIQQLDDPQEEQEARRKYNRIKDTEICVVVSSEQNEVDKFKKLKLDIAPHRKKMQERNLEKEFKDPDHPFRLAIVCAMWITGFDAQCVSTVYLDKPIKGHTLMQTIARANRVFDDEKENGLIVDYGNVYKQLEKAYSIYGEGGKGSGRDGSKKPERPVEELEASELELAAAIEKARAYLSEELGFELQELIEAKAMEKLRKIKDGADCVSRNETTRTTFEMMARQVFRKYKALFPDELVKPHLSAFNAIEAIYNQLNQNVKSADITEVMMKLQREVDESIVIKSSNLANEPEVVVDLSDLNFEKLRAAFKKSSHKNTTVFDLQKAVKQKLDRMMQENPLRLEFYERYEKIIAAYNQGKSLEDTEKAFENLMTYIQDLDQEDRRAVREQLNEETLAIFDLLLANKQLSDKDRKAVKKVAQETLQKLKADKLRIDRWRESRQIQAQVKSMIYDQLLWLPQEAYSDEDVAQKSVAVYQHVYASYPGGGRSVYGVV